MNRPDPEELCQSLSIWAGKRQNPRIAAVVLAAGHSRRMGSTNKLLADWNGKPLLRYSVETALRSSVSAVYVVVGHQAEAVKATLSNLAVEVIYNPQHASGLASSLRAVLIALPAEFDGVLVCLGDMPLVNAGHLNSLVRAFSRYDNAPICVPVHKGKRGNPVLLGRRWFGALLALEGDCGARRLINAHAAHVVAVPLEDDSVLFDIDTKEDLSSLRSGEASRRGSGRAIQTLR